VALDPGSSAMVDEARNYVINHALAEEVYLMRPDLVLAGTYTARATVSMLRRLGMRVELFAPSDSLQDVRETITRMGEVLHQEAEAEARERAWRRAGMRIKDAKIVLGPRTGPGHGRFRRRHAWLLATVRAATVRAATVRGGKGGFRNTALVGPEVAGVVALTERGIASDK